MFPAIFTEHVLFIKSNQKGQDYVLQPPSSPIAINNLIFHTARTRHDNTVHRVLILTNPNPNPNPTTKQHAIVNIRYSHMSYLSR